MACHLKMSIEWIPAYAKIMIYPGTFLNERTLTAQCKLIDDIHVEDEMVANLQVLMNHHTCQYEKLDEFPVVNQVIIFHYNKQYHRGVIHEIIGVMCMIIFVDLDGTIYPVHYQKLCKYPIEFLCVPVNYSKVFITNVRECSEYQMDSLSLTRKVMELTEECAIGIVE
jgi:hypothetical protein